MTDPWTKQRVALLKKLWPARYSAQQIADTINARYPGPYLTRCAVLGKRRRMGLPEKPKQQPKHRPGVEPRRAKKSPPPVRQKPADPLMIQTADLGPGVCHYPIGHPRAPGFGYCGNATSQNGDSYRTYCDHHHGLTHQKLPPKLVREPGKLELFTRKLNVGAL